MNKKKTIILLVIGILVVTTMSIGVTYSFMLPKITKEDNQTDIGINNCAKITLKDNGSTINLENTYPMEEEMGLQTDAYEFTVSSTCEEYIGFNLYLTTLTDNEIEDNLIRYAVTDVDDNVLITDLLTNKEKANDLNEEEIKELEKGIEDKRKYTYKVFNNNLYINEERTYKLYLWIDEKANNDTMNKSFKIKVSIKGYNWDGTIADYLITNKNNSLIYHDGLPDYKSMINAELEAKDESYRYTGGGYELTAYGKKSYNSIYDIILEKCGDETQHNNYWCSKYINIFLSYDDNKQNYNLKEALNKAIQDGLVKKKKLNNYICFGIDKCNETLNYDNLYRIIGAFKNQEENYELKIVKADYATSDLLGVAENNLIDGDNSRIYIGNNISASYYSYSNDTWQNSDLNNVNLNINFLKHFAENWQNMISLHKWQISNISWVQGESINTKTAYDYELGEFKEGIIDEKKIGLMYISDVYYSVPSEFWSYPGYIGPAEGDIEVHRDYRIGTW